MNATDPRTPSRNKKVLPELSPATPDIVSPKRISSTNRKSTKLNFLPSIPTRSPMVNSTLRKRKERNEPVQDEPPTKVNLQEDRTTLSTVTTKKSLTVDKEGLVPYDMDAYIESQKKKKQKGQRKKTVPWTDEETEALLKGIKQCGKHWSTILHHFKECFHEDRDSMSLRDKFRNLEKQKK